MDFGINVDDFFISFLVRYWRTIVFTMDLHVCYTSKTSYLICFINFSPISFGIDFLSAEGSMLTLFWNIIGIRFMLFRDRLVDNFLDDILLMFIRVRSKMDPNSIDCDHPFSIVV